MRMSKSIRLLSQVLMLTVFAITANAQGISCFAPGTLAANDSVDLTLVATHDIEKIYISEPFYIDGSQKLVFSLKVRNLHSLLSPISIPLGNWTVVFSNGSGENRFVQMSTLVGNPSFTYGTVTSVLGIPLYTVQGNIQGTYGSDGLVTLSVDKSLVGNPAAQSVLSVTSRTYVNTLGIGLVQIDDSPVADYTVLGNGTCNPYQYAQFGANGDLPVANDYTRNGTTDFAVWRPSTGMWYSSDSVTAALGQVQLGNGALGDVPVAADFDNDLKADPAVYRQSNGDWHIHRTDTGTASVTHFGSSGDIPAAGDFDGDLVDDMAVWRPSTGVWYILGSSDSSVRIVSFGLSEDRPVVGDYDGDRRSDIAVFRPSLGNWYIQRSSDSGFTTIHWGVGTDTTVNADYDGDGKTDIAVWRPETGAWYINQSNSGTLAYGLWGASPDRVQPGDYNGNGRSDFAVWRPETGIWYVAYR